MDKNIIDGMKKESKLARNVMIISFSLFLLVFVYMYVKNKKLQDKDVLSMLILYFTLGMFGFYIWLYAIKYNLKITEEKIVLKTLFRKIEIDICDIEKYTCKRYRKSVFYQFSLFIKDRRILVNTRYKEEFESILKDNKIEQITQLI